MAHIDGWVGYHSKACLERNHIDMALLYLYNNRCYHTTNIEEITMPIDSTDTVKAIICSAKKEFVEHGYDKASMRNIAKGAGVTTGALYQHFGDKHSLYKCLVEQVYHDFLALIEEQADRYQRILMQQGIETMQDTVYGLAELFMQYTYDNLEGVRLLISSPNQTEYGDFLQRLVDTDVAMTRLYLDKVKATGYKLPDLSSKELEIIISGQYLVYFQLIMNDIPKELLLGYIKTVAGFFSGGWKQLLSQED